MAEDTATTTPTVTPPVTPVEDIAKLTAAAIAAGATSGTTPPAATPATETKKRGPRSERPNVIWLRLQDEPALHKAIYDAAAAGKQTATEYCLTALANTLGIDRPVKKVDVLKTMAKTDRAALIEAALASLMAANEGKSAAEIVAALKSAK